jgi:DNA-binding NtrC family response regulator
MGPPAPAAVDAPVDAPGSSLAKMHEERDRAQRQRIEEALVQAGGNQTKAAQLLGVSRRTLVTWLGAYGFPRRKKRPEET